MALLSFLAEQSSESDTKTQVSKRRRKQKQKKAGGSSSSSSSSSSWDQIKNLLTCKQIQGSRVHDPSKKPINPPVSKLGSCCSFKDVVHGNTRVVHRPDSSANTTSSSSRGMQFRKLSGCYECHTILDPSRLPIPTTTLCSCSHCGQVFPKMETLELHQATRHAVSELGPEDSGRNIVEIIFKSSWLKKGSPICKIERILKVHNTQRTIQRFEECRDAVKTRALQSSKKNPRCAADGNELLRFHCSSLGCALGARASSSLCGSVGGGCGVCTIIRHGFEGKDGGVRTTASSGRAHDAQGGEGRRAMLVCRVIAGRVKRVAEETLSAGSYDSVAQYAGMYSNLEDLLVFNPRAILPCFVVIYKVES